MRLGHYYSVASGYRADQQQSQRSVSPATLFALLKLELAVAGPVLVQGVNLASDQPWTAGRQLRTVCL